MATYELVELAHIILNGKGGFQEAKLKSMACMGGKYAVGADPKEAALNTMSKEIFGGAPVPGLIAKALVEDKDAIKDWKAKSNTFEKLENVYHKPRFCLSLDENEKIREEFLKLFTSIESKIPEPILGKAIPQLNKKAKKKGLSFTKDDLKNVVCTEKINKDGERVIVLWTCQDMSEKPKFGKDQVEYKIERDANDDIADFHRYNEESTGDEENTVCDEDILRKFVGNNFNALMEEVDGKTAEVWMCNKTEKTPKRFCYVVTNGIISSDLPKLLRQIIEGGARPINEGTPEDDQKTEERRRLMQRLINEQ